MIDTPDTTPKSDETTSEEDGLEWYRALRDKYDGVDVTTLSGPKWEEWLSCHNVFERGRARGHRGNHKHRLKMEARAAREATSKDPT
jgi:hypothetical protein